ncbi:MAG: hypothetical protein JWO38_2711 [Gemmataceae bacterium]|nr:hypothetical protein [Gemmataceae bacterium]
MSAADGTTTDDGGQKVTEYLALAEEAGVPVSAAFTGFAYLRRLAILRRRATAMLPLFEDEPPASQAGPADPPGKKLKGRKPPLPGNRAWDSLRVVGCAGCGAVLLAESEELLRTAAAPQPHRPEPLLCLPLLPPPVAARAAGRPYCAGCLDKPVRRVGAPIAFGAQVPPRAPAWG